MTYESLPPQHGRKAFSIGYAGVRAGMSKYGETEEIWAVGDTDQYSFWSCGGIRINCHRYIFLKPHSFVVICKSAAYSGILLTICPSNPLIFKINIQQSR